MFFYNYIPSNFLEYLTLTVFIIISIIISLFIIVISYMTSQKKTDIEKISVYECGFDRAPSTNINNNNF